MEDELGKYMETYRKKNLEYIDTITVAIEEVKRKLDSINIDDNYGEYLRIKTCLSALERKKEGFLLTDQLTRQNIAAIYLSMQSLLETVVGLEISRDALIPLIGTGVVIGKGIETNVDGKDINRQVITLLNDIVKKNSDGIRTGMKELEEPLLLSADMKLLSDNLTSYVNTFVMSSTNVQKPISISKVWKTSYITFEYPNVFDTLKSFDDFLNFLKKLGFKKYRMNSQPFILQPSKYKGFEYGEDLFKQFVIDNNFEQYTFKDLIKIETIINKETILYLQNKGYNVPTYGYMTSIYYGSKDKGEQGKDEHGNFMKVRYMFEFYDKETNEYIYTINIWKFYKSGLCLLDEELR